MEHGGIITRDPEKRIGLADPARILAILRAYHPTPDLIASWAEMWTTIMGSAQGDPDEPV